MSLDRNNTNKKTHNSFFKKKRITLAMALSNRVLHRGKLIMETLIGI